MTWSLILIDSKFRGTEGVIDSDQNIKHFGPKQARFNVNYSFNLFLLILYLWGASGLRTMGMGSTSHQRLRFIRSRRRILYDFEKYICKYK